MKKQSVANQRAEVIFRHKMSNQQTNHLQGNEFTPLDEILLQRMQTTKEQMFALKEKHVVLSPYLELGAERGQRSLVMANDVGSNGAAVDISYDTLKSCEFYSKKYAKPQIPARICCDMNNLPFMSNSIPFIFCYQTLHHFPDISIVLQEIYRVLAPQGYFFFAEEAYKNTFHLNLYERSSVQLKYFNKIKNILDVFLAKREYDEGEEAGILENFGISVKEWIACLSVFKEMELKIEGNLIRSGPKLLSSVQHLTGGTIGGLCRKGSNGGFFKPQLLMDTLICPSCLSHGVESKITQKDGFLICGRCFVKHPILNNVLFLFSETKLKELYPEMSESL